MRTLMVECYSLLFKITRAKFFSYWFSLVYITALVFWAVKGFAKLSSGFLQPAAILSKLFNFPFYIGTALAIFALIFKFTPDLKQLGKERKTKNDFTMLVIFSLSVLLIVIYLKLGDSIFI